MNFIRKILVFLRIYVPNEEENYETKYLRLNADIEQMVEKPKKIEKAEKEEYLKNFDNYPVLIDSEWGIPDEVEFRVESNENKGILEDYFFGKLQVSFGKDIKNNIRIITNNTNLTPDFLLKDEKNEKYFVIEIDEPYTLDMRNEKIPIHYKGKDYKRDVELLDNGFSIIKFAEEQIIKDARACIFTILSFIANEQYENITKIKCWSKEEAIEMIKSDYRNKYLPFPLNDTSRGNSEYSFHSFTIYLIFDEYSKTKEKFIVFSLHGRYNNSNNVNENSFECWIRIEDFNNTFSRQKSIKYNPVLLERISRENRIFLYEHLFNECDDKMRFEGLGKFHDKYFNLKSPESFRIIPVNNKEINIEKSISETIKHIERLEELK